MSGRKRSRLPDYRKLMLRERMKYAKSEKRPFVGEDEEQLIKRLNAWTWPTLPPSEKSSTADSHEICCVADKYERRCDWTHIGVHISQPLIKMAIQNHYNLKRHLQAKHSYICVYHWRQIKYTRPGILWGMTRTDAIMSVTEGELLEMEADVGHAEDYTEPSTSDENGEKEETDTESVLSNLESLSISTENGITTTDDENEDEDEDDDDDEEESGEEMDEGASLDEISSDLEEVEIADRDLDKVELMLLRAQRRIRGSIDDTDNETELRRRIRRETDEEYSEDEESEEESETPLVNGLHMEEGTSESDEEEEEIEQREDFHENGEVEIVENGIDDEEKSEDTDDDLTDETEEDSEEELEDEEDIDKIESPSANLEAEEEEEDPMPDYYDPYKYESDDSHPRVEADSDKELIQYETTPSTGITFEETLGEETKDMPTTAREKEEQKGQRLEMDSLRENEEDEEIVENPEAEIIKVMSEFEAGTLEKVIGIPEMAQATLIEELGKREILPRASVADMVKALVREDDKEPEEEEQEEEETPRVTRLRRRQH